MGTVGVQNERQTTACLLACSLARLVGTRSLCNVQEQSTQALQGPPLLPPSSVSHPCPCQSGQTCPWPPRPACPTTDWSCFVCFALLCCLTGRRPTQKGNSHKTGLAVISNVVSCSAEQNQKLSPVFVMKVSKPTCFFLSHHTHTHTHTHKRANAFINALSCFFLSLLLSDTYNTTWGSEESPAQG